MRATWFVLLASMSMVVVMACADGSTGTRADATADSPATIDALVTPDAPSTPDTGSDAGMRTGQICDSCADDSDCGDSQHCAPLTVGGRACVPTCGSDLPECPRAFNCIVDVAVSTDTVCEPVGGPCCVDEDADGYGQGVGCMGRDCDDANDDRNPGVPDLCNTIDDDCDGTVDESDPEACDDGVDQDCDMDVDCADSDCAEGVACDALGRECASGACVCPGGATESMCGDATDQDCDGEIDCADMDCDGASCGADGRT
ncbi:MAG: putative metal-binding motif-containing protein, partial [Deltaproteobacteria bacterium]|nr:putative metal-binding motif-containing protein [Deltaproteobacteria bacterium]